MIKTVATGAVQLIRTLPFSLLESPTVTAKASPCPMQTTGGNRHLNLQSLLRAAYLFGFARDGWCKLCRLLLTFALLSLLFGSRAMRSEEHTSELQSLRHLVCRLLLEKKNRYRSYFGQHHEWDYKILFGANTYPLLSGLSTESKAWAWAEPMSD